MFQVPDIWLVNVHRNVVVHRSVLSVANLDISRAIALTNPRIRNVATLATKLDTSAVTAHKTVRIVATTRARFFACVEGEV